MRRWTGGDCIHTNSGIILQWYELVAMLVVTFIVALIIGVAIGEEN